MIEWRDDGTCCKSLYVGHEYHGIVCENRNRIAPYGGMVVAVQANGNHLGHFVSIGDARQALLVAEGLAS